MARLAELQITPVVFPNYLIRLGTTPGLCPPTTKKF
jgi:hypothetical protein